MARKEWSPYEHEGRENLRTITSSTSDADIADAMEDAIASLNHMQQYAIPAYLEAIRRLRQRNA